MSVSVLLNEMVQDIQFVGVGVLWSISPDSYEIFRTHLLGVDHHDTDHTGVMIREKLRLEEHVDRLHHLPRGVEVCVCHG